MVLMMLHRRPPQTTQARDKARAPLPVSARISRLETWVIALLLFNVVLLILTLAADGMMTYLLSLLR
jgi:hypothetical protein